MAAEGTIQRQRPASEIDEDEKPFLLPRGWAWTRLPEVSHDHGQCVPTQSFTYIDVSAIDNEKAVVAEAAQVVEAADAPSRARKRVAVGTVLYSTVRPYLRNIAIVEKAYSPSPIASTAFAVMHPHTGVDARYLLHYLRSPIFTNFVASKMVGVAYPAINDANFFQGVVPLPPSAEQTRIVARVEELMRLCDALEAKGRLEAAEHSRLLGALLGTLTDSASPEELADNWQRVADHFDLLLDRPEAVDALEQTMLQLAVRGLLVRQDPSDEPAIVLLGRIRAEKRRLIAEGKINRDKPVPAATDDHVLFELPSGWCWSRLPELASVLGGATPSKAVSGNWIGDIPWVSPKDMKVAIIADAQDHIAPAALKGSLSLISAGSLLMVVRGMILAHSFPVTQTTVPVTINQDMKALTPVDARLLPFLTLLCEGLKPEILKLVERSTHGTCKLESAKIFGLPIPFPPLAEQMRIVVRVNELRHLCTDLRERLASLRATQARLAEALIESEAA